MFLCDEMEQFEQAFADETVMVIKSTHTLREHNYIMSVHSKDNLPAKTYRKGTKSSMCDFSQGCRSRNPTSAIYLKKYEQLRSIISHFQPTACCAFNRHNMHSKLTTYSIQSTACCSNSGGGTYADIVGISIRGSLKMAAMLCSIVICFFMLYHALIALYCVLLHYFLLHCDILYQVILYIVWGHYITLLLHYLSMDGHMRW